MISTAFGPYIHPSRAVPCTHICVYTCSAIPQSYLCSYTHSYIDTHMLLHTYSPYLDFQTHTLLVHTSFFLSSLLFLTYLLKLHFDVREQMKSSITLFPQSYCKAKKGKKRVHTWLLLCRVQLLLLRRNIQDKFIMVTSKYTEGFTW